MPNIEYYFRTCSPSEVYLGVPGYTAMVATPKAYYDATGYLEDDEHPDLSDAIMSIFGWGAEVMESYFEVELASYNEAAFISQMAAKGFTMIPHPTIGSVAP